jgi:hypothetical protein
MTIGRDIAKGMPQAQAVAQLSESDYALYRQSFHARQDQPYFPTAREMGLRG